MKMTLKAARINAGLTQEQVREKTGIARSTLAEMRYVQNFVTLTPTVAIDAQVSERVDYEELARRMERELEDEFVAAAEGVYA